MLASIDLCTAILGLFMTLPLLMMARRRSANFWLGLFVFSLAWISLADYFYKTGLTAKYPQLFGIFDWPVAAIGSFFYCYVRNLVGLGNSRQQVWHFVPLMLAVIALLWLRQAPQDKTWSYVFYAFVFSSQALAFGYTLAVFYRLTQYRKRLLECFSSTKNIDLVWLSWLTLLLLVLLVAWIPAVILRGYWLWFLDLGRLLLLYFVGWYGMRQVIVFLPRILDVSSRQVEISERPESTAPQQQDRKLPTIAISEVISSDAVSTDLDIASDAVGIVIEARTANTSTVKYQRSGMNDASEQLIGKRLIRRMSFERDFLDSEIKLTELAERIGTSPQLLSQYLNHVLGLNFFDYINSLRVAEVQRLLCDAAHTEQSLLDIAFSAGFNSKSTFNASFKKVTGTTPSNWRNTQQIASEPIG